MALGIIILIVAFIVVIVLMGTHISEQERKHRGVVVHLKGEIRRLEEKLNERL